ncbi:MAG: hypothetical protein KC656_33610, partial [Myxococcales bacterium]|nr:hypothetical protein [Myxococcales bacterium]
MRWERTFTREGRRWATHHAAVRYATREDDGAWTGSRAFTDPEAMLHALDCAIAERLAQGWVETTPPAAPDRPPGLYLEDVAHHLHPFRRHPAPPLEVTRRALADFVAEHPDYLAQCAEEADGPVRDALLAIHRGAPGDPVTDAPALFVLASEPSAAAAWTGALASRSPARALTALLSWLELCEDWPVLPLSDDCPGQHPGGGFARDPGP